PFEVKEAQDGDELRVGRALIAPGGTQMKVVKSGSGYCVKIDPNAGPVNRHKPSVDYMFDSVVELNHKKLLGVILTGMGADGAKGLLKLRQKGARTIAQDEETSVVFGMPKEAIKKGAVEKTAPLYNLPSEIVKFGE
ncbi:MAG: chemotaxis protein CheB, partial [Leptospiraceae bacterium]|nr:chemotaxis protein CheB [Leptospiraceae bacterium]